MVLTLDEYISTEAVVVFGTVCLLVLLVAEFFDWTHIFSAYENPLCTYGYGRINGPVCWKEIFPYSKGTKQSPINISTASALCIPAETCAPLRFSSEYHSSPKDIRAFNDGHNVTIYARWENNARPMLSGGPLSETYQFFNIKFRWGPNHDEGSEHTIDSIRYALEVQATHVKSDAKYGDLISAAEGKALLIISFLYQVTPVDNPFLEPIVSSLHKLRCPYNKCCLEPMPLAWIIPPFKSKYFIYNGSLTHPPCTEGVKWIVHSEPLGISARQVNKFHKLMGINGPLELNTRPVQQINGRDIYYYD